MGIGAENVAKLVKAGIEAQAEQKANRRATARLFAEWGYKQCEKGMNVQAMLLEFDKMYGAE
jgi:hypothetical protein